MADPVNLTNLREMTGGDAEMEKELFKEFFSSSEQCITTLANTETGNEEWRKTAHALKGTAVNLGAVKLGDLCKQAQEKNTASADDKKKMLNAIQSEYSLVKDFLMKIDSK